MGARDKTAFAMVARIRAIVHTSFSLSTLFPDGRWLCAVGAGDVAKLEIDKAARRPARQNTFPGGGVSRNSNSPRWVSTSPDRPQARSMLPAVPGGAPFHGKPPV